MPTMAISLKMMERIAMYVYCSKALYSHSMPMAERKIVELTMI